jgi:hypothetical protein
MKEKPRAAPPNTVELLFVETADGVSVADGKLTLKGIGKTVIYFSDRPERLAGHYSVPEFLSFWSNGEGADSFLKDPPNATLSVFEPGQKDLTEAVVEISHPQLSGDDMTYDVKVLSGDLIWGLHVRAVPGAPRLRQLPTGTIGQKIIRAILAITTSFEVDKCLISQENFGRRWRRPSLAQQGSITLNLLHCDQRVTTFFGETL